MRFSFAVLHVVEIRRAEAALSHSQNLLQNTLHQNPALASQTLYAVKAQMPKVGLRPPQARVAEGGYWGLGAGVCVRSQKGSENRLGGV